MKKPFYITPRYRRLRKIARAQEQIESVLLEQRNQGNPSLTDDVACNLAFRELYYLVRLSKKSP